MLNKQKGNMYPFVSHTWNAIKGKCSHDCKYCYMKVYKQPELHLDEKELNTNLGSKNFIFVGSSTDMFAESVPIEWIEKTLEHCRKYQENTYLFQTKNPERFVVFLKWFPEKSIFGTTIETDEDTSSISKAPTTDIRVAGMVCLEGKNKMVSIEPIIDFDADRLLVWIKLIKPKFVSIGADSKGHNLPEPSPEKVKQLIENMKTFTEVKIKKNLERIIGV